MMTKVVLDSSLRKKLHNFDEQVEICDESGSTVGHFLPAKLFERLVYDWANAQISDEELHRRLHKPGEKTLTEIWERLKSR